jgi:glutamate N-acetyltransferase/amino-acid N-acetyltransferase
VKVEVKRHPVRVPGFRFAGVACGLKESGRRDVALIVSDRPATAVGVFTTNRVKAAPVVLGQERLRRGRVQAILVNSGNANAYTGRDGLAVAREMTALAAERLGIADARLVVPSSTGRIGVPVPRAKLRRGVEAAIERLSPDGFHEALDGIMTTDAFPKFATRRLTLDGRPVTIAVLAKGAGMIAPHMATLLVYVLTDANVARPALRRILTDALPRSFNAIVVDGDMSTNDTVLLLANGAAGNRLLTPRSRAFGGFAAVIAELMRGVARMVVTDGEGATRVIDIVVRGGRTAADAARVADTIARSPLCKTAFYGGDPYAGRIVCAAGYSGARFDPARLDVHLDDVPIVRRGVEVVRHHERRANKAAKRSAFTLTLDLHAGRARAERMVSDLTVDYVRFNSDYRT